MDKRLIIRSISHRSWDDSTIIFSGIKLKSNLFRLLRDASFNTTKSVYIRKKESKTAYGSWRSGISCIGRLENIPVSDWMMLGNKLVSLGFFKKISKGKQIQFKITKSTSSIVSFLVTQFCILGYYTLAPVEDKCLNKYFNLVENGKYIK